MLQLAQNFLKCRDLENQQSVKFFLHVLLGSENGKGFSILSIKYL